MRKEPYGVGSIVHVLKRGARGMPITKNLSDKKRFARLLYYMNDAHKDEYWEETTKSLGAFSRPGHWPDKQSLVHVYAWVLMPNHFHLILEEIQDGGISKFMQKLCGSMSVHFNLKYGEKGSIFQGPFKSRTVDSDRYFMHLAPYVMVKNVFELYPGGIEVAVKEFNRAWKWATETYPFSSLPDYVRAPKSPIIYKGALEMFESPGHFRSLARDMISGRKMDILNASLED